MFVDLQHLWFYSSTITLGHKPLSSPEILKIYFNQSLVKSEVE
jgi:hypothetical protein